MNEDFETRTIKGCLAFKLKMRNANLLLIKGKKGFIMCGYLDMESAERLGDAACTVTGVSSFEDFLDSEIKQLTQNARKLGIEKGMKASQALDILK